jgi:hypothetical protein
MGLRNSYFSLAGLNPFAALERWLHPYRHQRQVPLRGKSLTLRWTARAERALRRRHTPLAIEMQIYFSCVVKKRVLFPPTAAADAQAVEQRFLLSLSTVESDRCDPVTFAAHYPARATLDSAQAGKMRARELLLDYRRGEWWGEFFV